MKEGVSPSDENLGKNCIWWQNTCVIPKAELLGRQSCEGIIDDVCLLRLNGREPASLTRVQVTEIQTNILYLNGKNLPPGDIK